MKIVYLDRGRGKTKNLIEEALLRDYAIMVASQAEKVSIDKMCVDLDYNKPTVFTINEIKNDVHRGQKFRGYVVDNVDLVIRALLNLDIKAISLTPEETQVVMNNGFKVSSADRNMSDY